MRRIIGQLASTESHPFFASGFKGPNPADIDSEKPGILKSIVTYSKEGCLFDGDLLEEWVSKTLARKGIRIFGDLRSGRADSRNPRGYKIRMTGVDCNRVKNRHTAGRRCFLRNRPG